MSAEKFGFGELRESELAPGASAMNLFEPEPMESRIHERKPCQAKPTSGIQGTGPFEIYIASEKKSFIDPSSFRINAQFKIRTVNSATKAVEDLPAIPADLKTIKVAPINLMTKGVFKDIECELESQKVSLNASNTYAIKAYTSTVLSYGSDAVRNHLRCSYWKKDTPGEYNDLKKNFGAQARYKYIAGSRMVTMCDNLHTELTTTNRYILPAVNIKFKFIIENPSSFLITDDLTSEYLIEFHDFYLTYDRVLLKEQVHNEIERTLQSKAAIYPITRTEIRTKGFATGLSSIEWNNAYQGKLPDQVGIFMNTQEAADGKATKNIFNFENFGMVESSLIVNSRRIPAVPIKYDFANEECISAFRHLFDNTGTDLSNAPALIDYQDFMGGFSAIIHDLTTDRCALYHSHEKQEGSISLDIKLKEPSTAAINVYLIAIYKDHFFISGPNENRRVSLVYPTN